jgi:spermidine synthase
MKRDTILSRIWPQLVLIMIGASSGLAIQLNWWAAKGWFDAFERPSALVTLVRTALVATAAMFGLRMTLRWAVRRLPVPSGIKSRYRQYDTLTYAVFLLFLTGVAGIRLSIPLVYILGFTFLGAQFLLALLLLRAAENGERFFLSLGWLSFLFLMSGVAALIYQIVWQRVLFAAYGVNIESVTIIVSIFMFGLGVGSLVGGILSKRFPSHLPQLFVLCEVAIGCFGMVSLPLIKWVAEVSVDGSLLSISLLTYALLGVPTMFMGATLPILVTYLHRFYRHIGKSVGVLYCVNTIGSAIAALVTVDVLFVFLGQQSTVFIAAMCNFLVGSLVLSYCWKLSHHQAKAEVATEPVSDVRQAKQAYAISYFLALVLAGASGYISLSQEIIWVRAISYASGGTPHVFGHIVGFFLFGVAGGALLGKKVCAGNKISPLTFVSCMLLTVALFYYFSIPLGSLVMSLSREAGMMVSYLTVAIVAMLLGGIFPVLCHYGIRSDTAVGFPLAGIYMANILGSTAGPLLTGFVLMNLLTMEHIILYLSMLSLALAAGLVLLGEQGFRTKAGVLSGVMVMMAILGVYQDGIYQRVLERLHFARDDLKQNDFKYVVQNRSGIIAVSPEQTGDIIYGGGVYDGRFNLDPVVNSNGIRRAYMLAALHPNPEEILEIGLSSGSWTWVMAAHAGVKKITVVEINPGYPELIKQYPDHQTILSHPKISYQFDDGRRWLRRHPATRFDVILMNTTFHWRSNATNLLSREFLQMCRDHLKEGGIIYYNTTGSDDVIFTAASVFKYITTYHNFVAASDRPFTVTIEARLQNLLKFQVNGQAILNGTDATTEAVLKELAASDLSDRAEQIRRRSDLRVITEDNMLTEYKKMHSRISHLYKWYDQHTSWKNFHPMLAFQQK